MLTQTTMPVSPVRKHRLLCDFLHQLHLLFRLLPLPALFLATTALAQPPLPGNFRLIPYDADFLKETLEKNTIRASSAVDMALIPEEELYRTVFLRILRDPSLWIDIPVEDRQQIENLPEHFDARFAAPNLARLRAACQTMGSLPEVTSRANVFHETISAHSEVLRQHYASVLAQLSGETQTLVTRELIKLSESPQLTYASLNLVGLSEELPALVEGMLTQYCDRLRNPALTESRTVLLRDTLLNATRVNLATGQRQ